MYIIEKEKHGFETILSASQYKVVELLDSALSPMGIATVPSGITFASPSLCGAMA